MKKISYTISCAAQFRDDIMALATRRHVNPADLARSVLLMLPTESIDDFDDPGEPDERDRETITLKSGPAVGKLWQRKPRLQVRLPAGFDATTIRKALGLALSMDKRNLTVRLERPDTQVRRNEECRRANVVFGCLGGWRSDSCRRLVRFRLSSQCPTGSKFVAYAIQNARSHSSSRW